MKVILYFLFGTFFIQQVCCMDRDCVNIPRSPSNLSSPHALYSYITINSNQQEQTITPIKILPDTLKKPFLTKVIDTHAKQTHYCTEKSVYKKNQYELNDMLAFLKAMNSVTEEGSSTFNQANINNE
ncbi:MAG TPA: hypothetical protein VL201_00700 [Patescibacteria group bacterium]|jgi:hypothetical protein|nr:hypothetical protein [Patescibacteria group bacterium]